MDSLLQRSFFLLCSHSLKDFIPPFDWLPFHPSAFFSCSGTPAEHLIGCVPRHLPQALRSCGVVSIWCRPAVVLCVPLLQLAGLAGQDSEYDAHLHLELYRYIPNDHRHWAEWVVCSTHTTAASAGATGAWMRITTDTFHMAHSTFHNPNCTFHMPNWIVVAANARGVLDIRTHTLSLHSGAHPGGGQCRLGPDAHLLWQQFVLCVSAAAEEHQVSEW